MKNILKISTGIINKIYNKADRLFQLHILVHFLLKFILWFLRYRIHIFKEC